MTTIKMALLLAGPLLLGPGLATAETPGQLGPVPVSSALLTTGSISESEILHRYEDRESKRAVQRSTEPFPYGPAPAASRAIFSVGSDSNCDFATVAQALASPSVGDGDVLNLRSDLVTLGTTTIINRPGSLTLRGGFSDCSAPTPTAPRTVFDGDGSRVFYLETGASFSESRMDIHLENLVVTNGHASASFGGGGLMVNGRVGTISVQLRNVHVNNNSTDFNGGGISVRVNGEAVGGNEAMLQMDNASQLTSNEAAGNGGGLSCFSPAAQPQGTAVRLGTVAVVNNQASNGGGVAVDGCDRVVLYPGVFLLGIVSNTANGEGSDGNGGGIYVAGEEARVRVIGYELVEGFGDNDNGGLIGSNTARRGGGIYVTGSGYIDTVNIHLDNNTATVEGGAVYAEGTGALAEIDRRIAPCLPGSGLFALERCSVVSRNNGGNAGGAFSARNGGEIRVQGTRIFNNSSSVAAIAATSGTGGSSLIRIENSVGWGNQSIWGLASNHGVIELRWSTLTDNLTTDAFFRAGASSGSDARIRVYGSIVRESGLTSEASGTGINVLVFDCVIGWQSSSNFAGTKMFYTVFDPEFVNPGARDYRTGPTSPAIDYCDDRRSPPLRDFNTLFRGTEHAGDPFESDNPGIGFYDVGAFETRWRRDMLFRSRFQSGQ